MHATEFKTRFSNNDGSSIESPSFVLWTNSTIRDEEELAFALVRFGWTIAVNETLEIKDQWESADPEINYSENNVEVPDEWESVEPETILEVPEIEILEDIEVHQIEKDNSETNG